MSADILDGKKLAAEIREQLKSKVACPKDMGQFLTWQGFWLVKTPVQSLVWE